MKVLHWLKSILTNKFHLTALQQMLIAMVGIMLVVSAIFFSILSSVYRSNIREIVSDEMQGNVLHVTEYINLIISNSDNVSSAFITNPVLQVLLDNRRMNEAPIHSYPEFRAFYTLFNSVSRANEFVLTTDIYIQPRRMLLLSHHSATMWLSDNTVEFLDSIMSTEGDFWVSREYGEVIGRQYFRRADAITVIRPLFSINTGGKGGFIAINIHPYSLQRVLSTTTGAEYVLLDAENRLVVETQISDDSADLFYENHFLPVLPERDGTHIQTIDGREYIIITSTINTVDWRLVSFTPTDRLVHKGISLYTYLAIMIITIISILIITALVMMRNVMKRIRGLIYMMNRTKHEDINVKIDMQSQLFDEFSYLFTSYSSMAENVDFMVNEIYRLELMHKDVELRLLQSQVSPHFLYNIFNNMHWLIQLERYADLNTLVNATSVFYSRSLNDGRLLISIQDTMDKLNSYMQIQQIRFQDRFTFELEMDGELLEIEILNHLIQPLLENAIIHGIEPLTGTHNIIVTGKIYQEDKILITVSDDGAGISQERLEVIRENLAKDEVSGECFAMQNVHHRIQMFYGEQYGLSVESTPGCGTTATILIPHPFYNHNGGM